TTRGNKPMRKLSHLLRAFACICIFSCCASLAWAQTKPRLLAPGAATPASAIFIGNSFFYYNHSLHGHLGQLAAASEPRVPFSSVSVTISGSGANWHDVDSYFRPNAIGSY